MSHGLFEGTLVALSVLLANAGSVVPADARSASTPIRIVAFGDSLTAGYGLRPTEAFPARLQAALQAKGYAVTVANAGISGNTSAAGLARVQRAVPKGTDLAIIELDANDILRAVPPATTERNLDAILTHVSKTSHRVVLAGMIAPPGFGNADSRSFDSVFAHLADQNGATLYPFFLKGVAGRRGLNLPDGIHPNAAGVEEIVAGILPTIIRELEALGVRGYRKRERQVVTRGPRKGQIIETSKRPTKHLARFILVALYTGTRSRRVWNASFYERSGHPWIDVDKGVYHREAPGETASKTKRAPAIRIPPRLLAHLRRWRDGGHDPAKATEFLCEYRTGRPGDTKKAFARLVDDVLADEGDEIVRHSLRHTAATWLLQADEDVHAVAGYLGMNTNTLIKVYGHHHPAFQESIGAAFTSGRAGRVKKQK